MAQDDQEPCKISTLPTEIILFVFTFLPAKQLTVCRQVCQRWKQIIDALYQCDKFWQNHCTVDFKDTSKFAKYKSHGALLWSSIYKSLTLWAKLAKAKEDRDEFAAAERVSDEIMNFVLLRDGIIGVHKSGSIVYYDVDTLEPSCKIRTVTGDYLKYAEDDYVIAVQSFHFHLFLLRKAIYNPAQVKNVTFENVKTFILVDRFIYYATVNDEIYMCNTNDDNLSCVFIKRSPEMILCLGYTDCLNVLTFERNIFSVIGDNLVFKCTLGPNSNILQYISQCNLLNDLDWRVYINWMFTLKHTIPDGFFRHVITIRKYGKVFLLGSNFGVLRIYYDPYKNGELDLFNAVPVKQYNFARSCVPVVTHCPIIQIDVVENTDGHTVFVAMPKKIVTLKFSHECISSMAVLPYIDLEKATMLRIHELF